MNTLSHVAIIMDGNGRWAKKRNKSRNYGHYKGSENLKPILKYFLKKKIPYLTIFAFSLDNWQRPKSETDNLFSLLEKFLKKNINFIDKEKIKIKFIGEKKKIKKKVNLLIRSSEKKTRNNNKLFLTIALNYSSKEEIVSACNKLKKNKKINNIKINDLNKSLYTNELPDPQLLIRTGGHSRLSDFLLWQCSYTELFFVKKYWPDFRTKDLSLIINKYKKIVQNFGSI